MKRTLAIALSSLALAATSAQAVQPSFVDYAPIQASASSGASAGASVNGDFPKPSFVDYASIEAGQSSLSSSPVIVAGQAFPQPSFAN